MSDSRLQEFGKRTERRSFYEKMRMLQHKPQKCVLVFVVACLFEQKLPMACLFAKGIVVI